MTDEQRDKLMIETNKNVALNGQKIDLFKEEVSAWRTNHDVHHFSYVKWAVSGVVTIFVLLACTVGTLIWYIITHPTL